jgi:pimeloyl-ACP methyl ester carboxylesterase
MLRRDFLKMAMAAAVLTATHSIPARETVPMSNTHLADVNGQHIYYSVHGAGKPLILLHGGIDPDSFGNNLAELARDRQVIAPHLQAPGRTPDTRPGRCAAKRWVTTWPP